MRYKLLSTAAVAAVISACSMVSIQNHSNFSVSPVSSNKTLEVKEGKKDLNLWQPSIFKGIRVGKDSRDLARKMFGKPNWSGEPEGQNEKNPEIWDNYENIDELHRNITVMSSLKTGRILAIESHQNNLTVDEAIKIFGDNYKKTSYAFIPCTLKDGDGEIMEAPSGSFTFIEYRNKGIVLKMDSFQKEVHDIEYRSSPVGVNKSPCKQP